ncbi:MAG TPA: nucleotidyltransferase domain-containing protein [Dehalococcoidia bacterium]|jgi:predicted nucleotidyltransferase|nr:nucleotidyltransferase domain-containing protein [Dehalococcoidia bacterium]
MVTTEADLKAIIRKFVDTLKPVRVHKVILFGSYASGSPDEWSDIDIAVISDDFKRLGHNRTIRLLARAHRRCNASLEPLAFTLEEYERADHLSFLGQIKRQGKVIYEAE